MRPEDFSDAEVIALSGVLGIHRDINNPELKLSIDISRKSDYIRIYITSVEIRELLIIIYPSNRKIDNSSFVKETKRTGLAYEWVKMQVSIASIFPITKLEGSAHRHDADMNVKWNGYFIWPKFGYLMEEDDERDLKRQLTRDLRSEKDLQELFASEDGIAYWIRTGDTWKCFFDLGENSTSRDILNKYKPSGKIYLS